MVIFNPFWRACMWRKRRNTPHWSSGKSIFNQEEQPVKIVQNIFGQFLINWFRFELPSRDGYQGTLVQCYKNCYCVHQANPHVHQQHIVWGTTFRSGLPQPLSSQRLGQPRPKRRSSNNMLLVNVWMCFMIMISQQESSLKQDLRSYCVV